MHYSMPKNIPSNKELLEMVRKSSVESWKKVIFVDPKLWRSSREEKKKALRRAK